MQRMWTLRYPTERIVDGLTVAESGTARALAVVEPVAGIDAYVMAFHKVAPLYRWLPRRIGIYSGAPPSYFRLWVRAALWYVAWVSPGYLAWHWRGRSYSLFTRRAWGVLHAGRPFQRLRAI